MYAQLKHQNNDKANHIVTFKRIKEHEYIFLEFVNL